MSIATKLIERMQSRQQTDLEQYADLLHGMDADNPSESDVATLDELLIQLRKTSEDAERDMQAIQRMRELVLIAEQVEQRQEAMTNARKMLVVHDAETERIRAERGRQRGALHAALGHAKYEFGESNKAKHEANQLRQTFSHLFSC